MSPARPLHDPWPAHPRAASAARAAVRSLLQDHSGPGLLDAAELLVTELVTNVVLHVGGTVEVRAAVGPDEVLLEVVDTSPLGPQVRLFSGTSTTGRGMRLVRALGEESGVRALDVGKAVWVRITTRSAARTDDELGRAFAAGDDDGDADGAPGGAASPAGPSALAA